VLELGDAWRLPHLCVCVCMCTLQLCVDAGNGVGPCGLVRGCNLANPGDISFPRAVVCCVLF
jgi:hypothetical protein